MNIWCFSGRVGKDAELRTTQGGDKVLEFSIANDVGFGDRKTTQWVDCKLWGKRGESVAEYVRKGDKVVVSGELKLEEFQRRDGTPGAKLAVRVTEIDLDSRKSDQTQSGPSNTRETARRAQAPLDLDDEIPF